MATPTVSTFPPGWLKKPKGYLTPLATASSQWQILKKYLPQNPLTPEDESAKQSALHWERFADEEIGPHVRLLCYHVLLEHPEIVIPFFTHQGPWYGPIVIRRMFPKIRVKMRAFLKINAKSADTANQRLAIAIDKINEHRKGKDYMVGDTFTRADLAIASLLAPFCRPEKYGLEWPAHYPQALENLIEPYVKNISWVDLLYQTRQ